MHFSKKLKTFCFAALEITIAFIITRLRHWQALSADYMQAITSSDAQSSLI